MLLQRNYIYSWAKSNKISNWLCGYFFFYPVQNNWYRSPWANIDLFLKKNPCFTLHLANVEFFFFAFFEFINISYIIYTSINKCFSLSFHHKSQFHNQRNIFLISFSLYYQFYHVFSFTVHHGSILSYKSSIENVCITSKVTCEVRAQSFFLLNGDLTWR